MKIRPVGAEMLHTDRRTDGQTDMNLIVAFRNFAKGPKKTIMAYFFTWIQYTSKQKITTKLNQNIPQPSRDSSYNVVTAGPRSIVCIYSIYREAPEDGPLRSETSRAET